MGLNGPDEHEDGWPDDNSYDNPALIAGELDHRLTRAKRTELILSAYQPIEEDYTD